MTQGVSDPARSVGLTVVVAVVMAACAGVPSSRARVEQLHDVPAAPPAATAGDALQRRSLDELNMFIGWLDANDVRGFIGEVGWPDDRSGDAQRWNDLADRWYSTADAAGLPVSAWATGDHWGDYPLAAYTPQDDDGAGVAVAGTQARVLEAHLGTAAYDRGIAVAGGSFGDDTPTFSNAKPGSPGTDYWYPSRATLRYIASRGFDFVRIDFRWERLQPRLHRPLDRAELRRIRRAVRSAGDQGLGVVLDMHNYGEYITGEGPSGPRRTTLGSAALPNSAFVDVWVRLSEAFRDDPAIVAYGLMNEPHGLRTWTAQASTVASWTSSAGRWSGPLRHDAHRGRAAPGSLKVTWTDRTTGAFISDRRKELRYCARHGSLFTVWVYLPANAPAGTWTASLQVQDVAYDFHAGEHQPLARGRWTQVRYSAPPAVLGACRAVAVHIGGPPGAGTINLWVDDLQQRGNLVPAQVWEATSQAVLGALRERGDNTRILVSGHGWSKVQTWRQQHPTAWIIDPRDAFAYEAHHYWNGAQDSHYGRYADELGAAASAGW
jgi:hypothetical protein